jgi:hypothetical protein
MLPAPGKVSLQPFLSCATQEGATARATATCLEMPQHTFIDRGAVESQISTSALLVTDTYGLCWERGGRKQMDSCLQPWHMCETMWAQKAGSPTLWFLGAAPFAPLCVTIPFPLNVALPAGLSQGHLTEPSLVHETATW